MKIFHEYNDILHKCYLCKKKKARIIISKKRTGKSRKRMLAFKILCFNCWLSTRSFYLMKDLIEYWNKNDIST